MLQNKNILFLWRGCQSNQWYTFRGKSAKKWKTAHPNATTKSTWHQPFLNFIQHGYDKIVYQNDQIKSISWFVLDIKILAFLFGLGTVCRLLNRSLFNMMFQNETSYLVSLELSCYSNKHYWVWWSSFKTNLSMICNFSLWSRDKHDTNTLSLISNTTYIDVTDIFFLEIFDKLTIVDMGLAHPTYQTSPEMWDCYGLSTSHISDFPRDVRLLWA